MKKRVIGSLVAVAIVLGGAWLGGIAWSRHVFAERLDEVMTRLNASPALSASQQQLERGFLRTHGTLVVTWQQATLAGEPIELVMPWQARHGILATRFSGEADVRGGDDGPRLFADRLSPGERVQLSAVIHHFQRNGELDVTFPERVGMTQGPRRATLAGARLQFEGDEHHLNLKGHFDSLQLADDSGSLALGTGEFSSRRRMANASGEDDEQRIEQLRIEQLQVHSPGALPVTLRGLHWQGHAERRQGLLSYALSSRIEGIRVSQQGLGSLKLNATLDRLGAEAAERFMAGLRRSPASTADDWLGLIEPVESSFLAMLAPSPQLTLSELQVRSPMLDQPIALSGQLTFNGEGVTETRIAELRRPAGMRHFLQRLTGSFTLSHAPPLLALIIGQNPDQNPIEFAISDGELRVNDQPLLPLGRLLSVP
ncbi:uncharacterized protein DUF945 [Kushneria sinocarnis]|uniref:Uncharacterized protein DUF945 n=1 Tax=Kushneria sinocarnis TaxID=595502 RepID=A0A420WWV0_9GAMM|nr:DUF945 family protein [Kushneria sinocarnis]RKR04221.1 uncharacterized protein DUF945 [Kushneria sinocarnis]